MRLLAATILLFATTAASAHASFPATVETTVVPGGNAVATSPTLPATMKSATVKVTPSSREDEENFGDLHTILALARSPKERFLLCVEGYVSINAREDDSLPVDFLVNPEPLATLFMAACIQLAAAIDRENAGQTASASVRGCPLDTSQVPATFTRAGKGRYRATVDGTPKKPKGKGRLKVTCKRTGAGITLKVRPRKRNRSLRSVVGPKLLVGLYNPIEATGSPSVERTFSG